MRIAIVGSGPSGFHAVEALQKALPAAQIDLYDRLPTPFGLVRGGVAPDHPKIKSVTRVYDRLAAHPGFRFLGNVRIGSDLSHDELRAHYHAVLYATGAQADRRLGVPGEGLSGSHAATELVGWYNGHPDYRDLQFDLSTESAAVIGIGNVAMDIARILAESPDRLATTDLATHALAALRQSRIRTIFVIARRGPVQAACTPPELKELGELDDVDVIVDPRDLELDPLSEAALAASDDRTTARNLELLRQFAARGSTGAARRIVFHFFASPIEFVGDDRLRGIGLVRNRLEPDGSGGVRAVPTNETTLLPAGIAFRSVGYRGLPIPGIPFDERRGIIPNIRGRVHEMDGAPVPGLYVAGWIKRGPSGVIGTNKPCALESVQQLLQDAEAGRLPEPEATTSTDELLANRGVRVVSWSDWLKLDAIEQERGAANGRPREKFATVREMLEALGA
ncbi:MAG: FAD-dependent oxidoreductase [Gemmatimonadales bacterium]|nr:FAD-dependent oxidoreductase [Gemmatimonadales bacterium]MDZ4389334.1 FAD-dependent oxidoreductase [Gemmatimonadales bacterium]